MKLNWNFQGGRGVGVRENPFGGGGYGYFLQLHIREFTYFSYFTYFWLYFPLPGRPQLPICSSDRQGGEQSWTYPKASAFVLVPIHPMWQMCVALWSFLVAHLWQHVVILIKVLTEKLYIYSLVLFLASELSALKSSSLAFFYEFLDSPLMPLCLPRMRGLPNLTS